MKKIILIISLISLITTNSFSQVKWGASAGINMSNISMSETDNDMFSETKNRIGGIRFGISTEIPLSYSTTLNTGMIYSEKGHSIEVDYSNTGLGKLELKIRGHYLEIPLNISYKISNLISVNTGPFIGVFVGGTLDINDSDGEFNFTEEFDAELGLSLGTKFRITDAISANAGYQIGFGEDEVYDTNILFGITYFFNG